MKTTATLAARMQTLAHKFLTSLGCEPGELEAVTETPGGFNFLVTTSRAAEATKRWFETDGKACGAKLVRTWHYEADEDCDYPTWCLMFEAR